MQALITGASSGIGLEFARQLYRQGYDLILIARRRDLLEQHQREFQQRGQQKVQILPADLTLASGQGSLESVLALIKTNQIDLLVNNAGSGSFGYFEELDLERESAMIDLNIRATMTIAHAVIPQMKARRSGSLISVSSVAAFQPLPFMATYAATKAFNFIHSLALREELRPFGVRVHILCPGPTATEFGGVARVPGTAAGGFRDSVELVVAQSLAALANNQAFITPGLKSRLMCLASRLLPVSLTTRLVGNSLKNVYNLARRQG